jgi:hypothetical protein
MMAKIDDTTHTINSYTLRFGNPMAYTGPAAREQNRNQERGCDHGHTQHTGATAWHWPSRTVLGVALEPGVVNIITSIQDEHQCVERCLQHQRNDVAHHHLHVRKAHPDPDGGARTCGSS